MYLLLWSGWWSESVGVAEEGRPQHDWIFTTSAWVHRVCLFTCPGDGVLPGNLHGEVHRDVLHLRRVAGDQLEYDDEVQGRHHNLTLPENFEMQVGV